MLLSVGRTPIRLSSRISVAHRIVVDCVQALNGLRVLPASWMTPAAA